MHSIFGTRIAGQCSSVTDTWPCPRTQHSRKVSYRRRLPHVQKTDADLFVTFCTGGRKVLPAEARDLMLKHCLREGGICLSRARAPAPHSPSINLEFTCTRSLSCRTMCTFCSGRFAMKMAGRFLWSTFSNASRE